MWSIGLHFYYVMLCFVFFLIDVKKNFIFLFRFTVYKLPENHISGIDRLSYDGVGFYYMDSLSPSWTLSTVGINATGHSVEHTLRQIYKNVSRGNQSILTLALIN